MNDPEPPKFEYPSTEDDLVFIDEASEIELTPELLEKARHIYLARKASITRQQYDDIVYGRFTSKDTDE